MSSNNSSIPTIQVRTDSLMNKIKTFNLPDFHLVHDNLPSVQELDKFLWGFIVTHKSSAQIIHYQKIIADFFFLMFVQNRKNKQKFVDSRIKQASSQLG